MNKLVTMLINIALVVTLLAVIAVLLVLASAVVISFGGTLGWWVSPI